MEQVTPVPVIIVTAVMKKMKEADPVGKDMMSENAPIRQMHLGAHPHNRCIREHTYKTDAFANSSTRQICLGMHPSGNAPTINMCQRMYQ
jgi:hypothetical protein